MAISTEQRVDYLFKKLGYGLTKTDTNDNKKAPNESIPSPLLIRGDRVWKQSSEIPSVKPSSSTGVVTCYKGSTTVEATEDNTATADRTWKTGITDWIPPEFGSTYLVSVFVHTAGDAENAESSGTRVFVTGSGNNDEWFFDYQSGVLNFIGDNYPNGINFTGKSVYIAGATYTGELGVGSVAGEDSQIGNLEVSDTTVTTVTPGADIILSPTSGGKVDIDSSEGLLLPDGTTSDRSLTPSAGEIRFNTTSNTVEFYDGTQWRSVGTQTNLTFDTFIGDDSTTTFTLSQETTDAGVIVSVNGVLQHDASYSVTGTTLEMAEPVAQDDKLEARIISATTSVVADNLGVYTTAQANSLSSSETGDIIYVSDGDAGSPCVAVYTGSNWKRISLGSNISTT